MYLTDYKSNSHALPLYKSNRKRLIRVYRRLSYQRQKNRSRQWRFPQSTAIRTPISTKTRPLGRSSKRNLHQKNTVVTTKFSARKPTRTEAGRRTKPCLTSQRRDLSFCRSSTQLQKRCHLTSNLGQTARKAPEQGGSASRSRLSPPIRTTLTIFILSRHEKATQ